jgi:XRE family transcriptional regulator, master regulator for biofilm formation
MLGKNIYNYRMKRGLTLSDLAERANISKSYLSTIERNLNHNPSIYVIDRIAKVLNVELKTLLAADEDGLLDSEWVELINEFKQSGIEKEHIEEYKDTLIEFIKWKKNTED